MGCWPALGVPLLSPPWLSTVLASDWLASRRALVERVEEVPAVEGAGQKGEDGGLAGEPGGSP